MSTSHFLPRPIGLAALAAVACAACAAAQAQQTVVVTGNPRGCESASQPASVLSGVGLTLRRSGTLGETLDGLPGVSASGFGPNASRPVIRGLDGDRVRLLDNGGASVDASNLSFDHASATDPLVAERVEVLRGPAALLYGGNATGGVVNSIDNRIPRVPASGLSGRAEMRLGGAAAERSGAAVLEGGGASLAWHADAYGRQAGDLRVPLYTPQAEGAALDPVRRVRNSAARSAGGAVGAGWATEQGYLGAAVETADQHYGVTVEPDVFIRMQRQRVSLAGELRALPGPFSQLTAQASQTRYEHQEVEGSGELGTTFKSRGSELRLQARHAGIGGLDAVRGVHGVMGLQAETMTFSALGAEAFVPGTRTRSGAVFALEEWSGGAAVLSAGARVESVRVASNGDDPTAAEVKFGAPGQRRFTPTSLSLGARAAPADGWSVSGTLSQTERAPAYYELYANGVHVATAAYERGNPQLPAERSRHAEAGLGWSEGPHMLKASLFSTRFSRFISLDATGTDITIPGVAGAAGTVVPEYAFSSVRARMDGVEIECHTRLLTQPFALDLSAGLDTARGSNLDSGEPLPRLAPLRARAALEAAFPGWHAGLGVRHAARQARVPATDSATPGHTLLDLWAGGPIGLGEASSWFARLNNATNQLAYSAATITTMRGLAPLPGRALTLGLRGQF